MNWAIGQAQISLAPWGVLSIYFLSQLTLIGLDWLHLFAEALSVVTECGLPQEECSLGQGGCLLLRHTLMELIAGATSHPFKEESVNASL